MDLDINEIYFATTILLMFYELYQFVKYRNILESKAENIIQFKNDKISKFLMAASPFILFHKLFEFPIGLLSIFSIVFILTFTILNIYRNYYDSYIVDNKSIKGLNSSKEYLAVEITEIEFLSNRVNIHTKKFRNDLVFEKTKARSPNWKKSIKLLKKISCPKESHP